MKKILTFLMMTLMSFIGYATEVTFTAGTDWGTEQKTISKNGVTITTTYGVLNGDYEQYRLYANSTNTFSCDEVSNKITKIEFTFNSGSLSNFTIDSGGGALSNNSWTNTDGSNAVVFKMTAQVRLTKIIVTYESTTPAVVSPEISGTSPFANTTEVTITCTDTDATIYYTTDGNDPTSNSTQYTVPFTLNNTSTVKAIAYKGNNHSSIVSKDFIKLEHVSTISALNALTDNTEFIFDGEVICVYQHEKFTYIQDETAATLLYGTINDNITYNITDVIPSGWQGKKITYYERYSEVTTLSGFTAASASRNLNATKLNLASISTDDFGKYVVAKNVLISTGTPEPPTPVGTEVIFDFNNGLSDLGLTSPAAGEGKNLETPITHQKVTLSFTNSGTATRIWNASGTTELRVYNGGTLTFTVSNGAFTQIVLSGTIHGTFNDGTYSNKTWTGNTSSVTFTANNTCKINTITFTIVSTSNAPLHAQTVTDNYTLTDDGGNTLNAYPNKLGYKEIPDDLTKHYDAYGVLDFHSGKARLLPLGFIDSEGTVTSVTDINDNQVIDMKYYDITGRESSKPYDGLNIVVLKYQNGKTKTIKALK